MSSARRILSVAALSFAIAPAAAGQSLFDWTDETFVGLRGGYTIGEYEAERSRNSLGFPGTQDDYTADEAGIEFSAFGGARFLEYGVLGFETYFGADADTDIDVIRSDGNFTDSFERTTTSFGALANVGGSYKYDRFRITGLAGVGIGGRSLKIKSGAFETDREADFGLIYQGRVSGEVDVSDRWSVELSAAFRGEPELEYDDLFLGTDPFVLDSRGVTNFGLGFVYRFGGDRPSRAGDGYVRPASFDGFPPAAEPRRVVDEPLEADRGLSTAAAPTPRTSAELSALRARLAALEERADEIAFAQPAFDSGGFGAPPPVFDGGSTDFGLTTPPLAPTPLGIDAAPPLAPPALTPPTVSAPAAQPGPATMADVAEQMRAITGAMTGAPAPVDPFLSSLPPASGVIPAASGARADHYVAVAQTATPAGAEAAWAAANAQYPDLLAGLPAAVEDWAAGGPRVHAGPTTPEAAAQICGAIRARGGQCGVASAAALGFQDAAL